MKNTNPIPFTLPNPNISGLDDLCIRYGYFIMEEWKIIKDFENYAVSNLGKVKKLECKIKYNNGLTCNYREKILNPEVTKHGYMRVTLSNKNKQKRYSVHRLVSQYYINNPYNKNYVNHKNGDKSNNRVENLEWCTSSENELHSFRILKKHMWARKLTPDNVQEIRSNFIWGVKGLAKNMANYYGVNFTVIYNVVNHKSYNDIT